MKDGHIIDMLDNAQLATLDESERAAMEEHANECTECQSALTMAYISASLLREHTAESFSPSPFFATKVLAIRRERQSLKDAWGLGRMWRAAGALVSSMAVTVAALGLISFLVPGNETPVDQDTVSAYSADAAILGPFDLSDEQVSDGQVLNTLYEADEETAR